MTIPFSESGFRTMKYRPGYPRVFMEVETARAYIADYVPWYNTKHKHSGIALFSPSQVHDGSWKQVWTTRDHALQNYYEKKPWKIPPTTHHTSPGRPRRNQPPKNKNHHNKHHVTPHSLTFFGYRPFAPEGVYSPPTASSCSRSSRRSRCFSGSGNGTAASSRCV